METLSGTQSSFSSVSVKTTTSIFGPEAASIRLSYTPEDATAEVGPQPSHLRFLPGPEFQSRMTSHGTAQQAQQGPALHAEQRGVLAIPTSKLVSKVSILHLLKGRMKLVSQK